MRLYSIDHVSFHEKKDSMGQQALYDTLKLNFGNSVAKKDVRCAELCTALVSFFQH